MTQEEGNKLIAEFMIGRFYKSDPMFMNGNCSFWSLMIDNVKRNYTELKYHTSWDWLMPVVEKIQSLGLKFIIGDSNRVTVYNKDYDWRNGSTSDSLIECVWYGTTEFIKWYNQNPQ